MNARLAEMARIGATARGGVDRQALTPGDAQAQRLLADWGDEIGMHATRDAAGNLFLRLAGAEDELPCVLSGSHLDSQPTGGRYDGVYGVLAALEAVQAIVTAGITPLRALEVVAWMNEEGSRFAPGMMGSSVYGGERELAEVLAVTDSEGISVAQAMAQVDAALPAIATRPLPARPADDAAQIARPAAHGRYPYCYIEAHIEQGPMLEREGLQVGVVSGIQGKHTFTVAVTGEAAHAGTSTRAERRDALLAATAMVQALAHAIHDEADLTKFTIGRFTVTPNAPSVVASRVVFSIDLRHPDTTELRRLAALVEPVCRAHAGPCTVSVTTLSAADSLQFPQAMRERISTAATALGIGHREILSAAGHDARYLHPLCASAMIFVPCREGITHNEAEYASPEDLAAGTRVLANVLAELCMNKEAP
ncbi:MAG: Zn-dependent hydrolase [Comamonadaceae bacterium]|nr:MAG: Zn-dependent hydrolase [Comamonadaceae bacterium]